VWRTARLAPNPKLAVRKIVEEALEAEVSE
jgi:hypothetical protein